MSKKQSFNWEKLHSIIILVACFCIALGLYFYSLGFPQIQRVRGDAYEYLAIANKFTSIPNAMAYVSDRTYGFPLFLYIIKEVFSPKSLNDWALKASYVQFFIHIFACLMFYQFFLKQLFKRLRVPNIFTAIAAGIIIAYPALITYTTIPLTDTFCADIMMFVAVLYYFLGIMKKKRYFIILAFVCGLLLGYSILVRPSFWPPVIAFYVGILFELFINQKIRNKIWLKLIIIGFGTSILIVPSMYRVWHADHSIGIQNSNHFRNEKLITLHDGLAGVRIFWSIHNQSQKYHPGTYDPMLKKIYYNQCTIYSSFHWAKCLFSRPLFIPVFFWKKTLSLFDAPNVQPYTTDFTPNWFIPLERIFGMLSFCGFISYLMIIMHNIFFKNKIKQLSWPLALFVISLILQHAIGHVEARFVFSTIPFLIPALFLGFVIAKRTNKTFFTTWIYAICIFGISFLCQTYIWDSIQPI